MNEWDLALSSLLVFSEKVDTNIKGLVVLDGLNLVEVITINQHKEATSQFIRLLDVAKVTIVSYQQIGHGISLVQDAQPRVDIESANNHLSLVQTITLHQAKGVYQTLSLIDLAVCVPCKGTIDTLKLTQTVTVQKSSALTAQNTLVMSNKARVYEPSYNWISDPTLTVMA